MPRRCWVGECVRTLDVLVALDCDDTSVDTDPSICGLFLTFHLAVSGLLLSFYSPLLGLDRHGVIGLPRHSVLRNRCLATALAVALVIHREDRVEARAPRTRASAHHDLNRCWHVTRRHANGQIQ